MHGSWRRQPKDQEPNRLTELLPRKNSWESISLISDPQGSDMKKHKFLFKNASQGGDNPP
jgi:hypothetical protein